LVIIPTYNHGEHVTQAIDSVFARPQTYYELIAVDDGFADDTRKVPEDWYGERIRYLYQPNKGCAGARSDTGIRAARHGLPAFLDSDDMPFTRRREIQVLLMSDRSIVFSYRKGGLS
jgi:glycosyltransferase involved in cell wall biosynthesis